MERDGFGEHPLFYSFVAETDNKLVGYAIYYYIFSTWRGKSMFLDELFVLPKYRSKGTGGLLFDAVARVLFYNKLNNKLHKIIIKIFLCIILFIESR